MQQRKFQKRKICSVSVLLLTFCVCLACLTVSGRLSFKAVNVLRLLNFSRRTRFSSHASPWSRKGSPNRSILKREFCTYGRKPRRLWVYCLSHERIEINYRANRQSFVAD